MARNKGFSIVEIVLVVVVLALIGLVGWRFWSARQATDNSQQNTTQSTKVNDIKSSADLDSAAKQLDNSNVDGTESQQLDSQTNF